MNAKTGLSRDMELVADVIGRAAAIELIRCMGGVNIYIPKAGPVEIMERLRTNAMDVKLTAKEMGVSQSKVYQIWKEFREEKEDYRQKTIFDSPDYKDYNDKD